MDEGSNGTILSAIRNLFRKNDSPLDEMFKDAVAEGEIKSDDVRILQTVIDLEERRVSEIMIPRPDIICAEQDDTLADFSNWGSAVDLAAPGVITSTERQPG